MGRKPYSDDLRARVVSAVGGGCSRHAAVERFAFSVSSAIRWVALRNARHAARTVANELAALPPLTTHYIRVALTQWLRRLVEEGAGYDLALEGIGAALLASTVPKWRGFDFLQHSDFVDVCSPPCVPQSVNTKLAPYVRCWALADMSIAAMMGLRADHARS
jgi:hypothetical protein